MTDWTALEQAARAALNMPDDLSPTERREWKPRMTVDTSTILALLAELREAQAAGQRQYDHAVEATGRALRAEAEAARLQNVLQATAEEYAEYRRLTKDVYAERDAAVKRVEQAEAELREAQKRDQDRNEYCDELFARRRLAEKTARRAEAEAARLREQNQCDACMGTGTPISGKSCMCRGTGLMSVAALHLREQVQALAVQRQKDQQAALAIAAETLATGLVPQGVEGTVEAVRAVCAQVQALQRELAEARADQAELGRALDQHLASVSQERLAKLVAERDAALERVTTLDSNVRFLLQLANLWGPDGVFSFPDGESWTQEPQSRPDHARVFAPARSEGDA